MRVENAAVVIDTRPGRDLDPLGFEPLDIGMSGRQSIRREAFEWRVLPRRRIGGQRERSEYGDREQGRDQSGDGVHPLIVGDSLRESPVLRDAIEMGYFSTPRCRRICDSAAAKRGVPSNSAWPARSASSLS